MSTASLGYRGVSNTMKLFENQEKIERAPSVETCIQWEMKLGLHKLTRPKEKGDDWVWIADHVVSRGAHKCLVVLGVRMEKLLEKEDLTLTYEDVEPLGIVPMQASNGKLMKAEFDTILKETGGVPPLAILKDQGSDLRCGGTLFSEVYPDVINLNDVPHLIANLYKKWLGKDEEWLTFTKECANFKKQVQLL